MRAHEFLNEDGPHGRLDLFEMANLRPQTTGLPFVVWVSPKGGARHGARVKVTTGPRYEATALTITIDPITVIGGKMTSRNLELISKWIELNRDALIAFWEGGIEYTEDLLSALKPV